MPAMPSILSWGFIGLCGLCRCLVADTHFLGQRMGQRRFSWLIEKAKQQHPSPPDPLPPLSGTNRSWS